MQQVLTLDLHHMQMEGFFSVTIDNVKSSPLLIEAIKEHVRARLGPSTRRARVRLCVSAD